MTSIIVKNRHGGDPLALSPTNSPESAMMLRYVLFLKLRGYWRRGGAFSGGEVVAIVLKTRGKRSLS